MSIENSSRISNINIYSKAAALILSVLAVTNRSLYLAAGTAHPTNFIERQSAGWNGITHALFPTMQHS